MASWRTVRVFISSTFRDMQAERDWLVKRVFPALRQRLEPHRIELIDIDLRWGLRLGDEQEESQRLARVVELCLGLIAPGKPFFVCLLGERYGTVADTESISEDSPVRWARDFKGRSITELEIVHGVLNVSGARQHAYFYFRDSAVLADIPPHSRQAYAETDPELKASISALKARLRDPAAGCHITDYTARWEAQAFDPVEKRAGRIGGLEDFGTAVLEQLWAGMQREFHLRGDAASSVPLDHAVLSDAEKLAQEQDFVDRFIESRSKAYVVRWELQRDLETHVDGVDPAPCLVRGVPGSGKSAALAHLVTVLRTRVKPPVVIAHFVGASPRSTSLVETLWHLCAALKAALGFEDAIKQDIRGLAAQLHSFLGQVSATQRVVIVLDAVNEMDEVDHAQSLFWLPALLPPHVRLIVSCVDELGQLPHEQPAKAAMMLRRSRVISIAPLDGGNAQAGPPNAERRSIIEQLPALAAKALSEAQIDLLLDNEATRNPLFLIVALEEMRALGSPGQLAEMIATLPQGTDTLTAIFQQMIRRLCEDFDATTARSVLKFLSCSRSGLSERELLDLVEPQAAVKALARLADQRPGLPLQDLRRLLAAQPDLAVEQSEGDLFPILRQLRRYLQRRGTLLDFFHRHLDKAVRIECFASGEDERHRTHRVLRRYFRNQARGDWRKAPLRALSELPFQMIHEGRAPCLEKLFGDALFLTASIDAGLFDQLLTDLGGAVKTGSSLLATISDGLSASAAAIRARPSLALPIIVNRLRNRLPRKHLEQAEAALRKSGDWLCATSRFSDERPVHGAVGVSQRGNRFHLLTADGDLEDYEMQTHRLCGFSSPFGKSQPVHLLFHPVTGQLAWLDEHDHVYLGQVRTSLRLRTRQHGFAFLGEALIGVDEQGRLACFDPRIQAISIIAEGMASHALTASTSADGLTALVVSGDRPPSQRILKLTISAGIPRIIEGPALDAPVCAACLNEDGSLLLVATRMRQLLLFEGDTFSLRASGSYQTANGRPVRGVAGACRLGACGGGTAAIVATNEGELCVWNPATGEVSKRGRYTGLRQQEELRALELIPGTSSFVVATPGHLVVRCIAEEEPLDLGMPITRCAGPRDGWVVLASQGTKMVTWFKDGQFTHDSSVSNLEPTALALGDAGEVLAGYSFGRLLHLQPDRPEAGTYLDLFDRPIVDVIRLDADRALVACDNGGVKLIDTRTLKPIREFRPATYARNELCVRRLGKSDAFVSCGRSSEGEFEMLIIVVRGDDCRETVVKTKEPVRDVATCGDSEIIVVVFAGVVRSYRRGWLGWSVVSERKANATHACLLDARHLLIVVRENGLAWLELWDLHHPQMITLAATELPCDCTCLSCEGTAAVMGAADGWHGTFELISHTTV